LVLLRVRLLGHLLRWLRLLRNGLRSLGLLLDNLTDAHPLQLLDGRDDHIPNSRIVHVDWSIRVINAQLSRY
jgi:hypothetical protein